MDIGNKFKVGQRVRYKKSKMEVSVSEHRYKHGEWSYKVTDTTGWWIPEDQLEECWR